MPDMQGQSMPASTPADNAMYQHSTEVFQHHHTAGPGGIGPECSIPCAGADKSQAAYGNVHAMAHVPNQREVMRDVSVLPQYNRNMMAQTSEHVHAVGTQELAVQSDLACCSVEQGCMPSRGAGKRQRTAVALDFDQDDFPTDLAGL